MGRKSRNHKLCFSIKYFISVSIVFLIVFSNFFVSGSSIAESKFGYRDKSNLLVQSDDLWHDGRFQGKWGTTKELSDGLIWGDLDLKRTSSIGNFYGEFREFGANSSGTMNGVFINGILMGNIENGQENSKNRFIGLIRTNETGFNGVVFGLKLSFVFVQGDYESSFLPPLTGDYGVGVKSLYLIDENRLEEFTQDVADDFREMMIQIWYPIDKEILEPRIDYMDAPTFAWLKGRSPVPLFTIPDNGYSFVRPHARFEPPISNANVMYPVIIFSPGYDGVYQIYTSFIEDMVSNGYIVVSINHPYVSGITVFPDGREIYVSDIPPAELSLNSVVDDAKFVLDNIFEMNNSDDFFKGRFDLSKVGMYGHSFGGASTSICCYQDERFLCGLTLDGVFYLDYIPEKLEKPFLLMIAENRFNNENVQDMWNTLDGDAYKVEIGGSTHYAYTDVGVLLKHLLPLVPPVLLGFGTIEPKLQVNITRMITKMFFDVYLRGEDVEDLITFLSSIDEVNFEYK